MSTPAAQTSTTPTTPPPVTTAPAPAASPVPSPAPAPAPAADPKPAAPATSEPESLIGGAPPKTAEAPKEGEKPPETAPEKPLELKLPEGVKPETLAPFLEVAKAHKLSQEQAQALVDFDRARQAEADKSFQASWKAEQTKWVEAVKADPEIGAGRPEVLAASIEAAKRAVAKFGGPELARELLETGLGNNPVWVRAFVRIGKAMADDSIAGTSGGAASTPSAEEQLQRSLYPTMFSKKES